MTPDPLQLQNYDLAKGLEFVAFWIAVILITVLVFTWPAHYRLMNAYDEALAAPKKRRKQIILDHMRYIIFAVLGYKGEDRERQRLSQINANWVFDNFGSIFIRFSIFYFIYIWALILTTRPLLIDTATGEVHIMAFTSKAIFGFLMIFVYIFSTATFDILSIYVTLRHIERIKRSPGTFVAALLVSRNLAFASLFFCMSQVVSNVIWPLKTNTEVPFTSRVFSPAITLWPYAFVFDTNSASPEYMQPFFPGQLLITTTVFLPTVIVMLLSLVFLISIYVLGGVKRQLIAHNLVPLRIQVTLGPGEKSMAQFGWLNAITIGIVTSLLGSMIYEWLKFMVRV
jgi:hypothetical protein